MLSTDVISIFTLTVNIDISGEIGCHFLCVMSQVFNFAIVFVVKCKLLRKNINST